jgi:hypothetical protein
MDLQALEESVVQTLGTELRQPFPKPVWRFREGLSVRMFHVKQRFFFRFA